MAKVTAENLEPIHVRAGRALLSFRTKDLAAMIDDDPKTHMKIRNFESGRTSPTRVKEQIIKALTKCGIELQNGGKPGARVKDAAAFASAASRKATP